nr:MAG TPA: hypothetical protein [Bacteriophage sp.]
MGLLFKRRLNYEQDSFVFIFQSIKILGLLYESFITFTPLYIIFITIFYTRLN